MRAAAEGWPRFHALLAAPGQPLPRVWEHGCNVGRVVAAAQP